MTRKKFFPGFLRLFFLCFLICSYGVVSFAWASEKNATGTEILNKHVLQCGPDCDHSSQNHDQEHPADHADHEHNADHEHVQQCGPDCDHSSQIHDHEHHADHADHEHHANHGHVHHHHGHAQGHVCTVCGGAHDESVHQKELERTRFETIEVKYSILKNRALATVGIAVFLALLAIIFKAKGKI